MIKKTDSLKAGLAVAPKPQPHLYNAWFQEIYMQSPEVNPVDVSSFFVTGHL